MLIQILYWEFLINQKPPNIQFWGTFSYSRKNARTDRGGAGRGGDGRVSELGSQCDPESWNLIVAALRRLGTLGLETLGQCCGHWVTITLRGGRGGAGAGRGEAAGTCVPSKSEGL